MNTLLQLVREFRGLETHGAYYAWGFMHGAAWLLFIVMLLTSY